MLSVRYLPMPSGSNESTYDGKGDQPQVLQRGVRMRNDSLAGKSGLPRVSGFIRPRRHR